MDTKGMDTKGITIPVHIDTAGIDEATEKMNRLKELLSEVNSIIGSFNEIKLDIKVGSEQPNPANIIIELDGKTLAKAISKDAADMIRVKTDLAL